MKKLFVLGGLILGFSVITMSVSAQTSTTPDKSATTQSQQAAPAGQGKFVDNNKDGVCDNHQNNVKTGKCSQFVDKNGDGKCDNCQGNGNCVKGKCCGKGNVKGNCCPNGQGKGMQHRHGQCPQGRTAQPEKK